LEAWLHGHRERVEAKGEQIALHPVISEFRALIDSDPVVRMYLNQMITQVPDTKPYRKRHLESVDQLLRLINEVLTMAPEFGSAMVATPLGAILDWTMGNAGRLRGLSGPADQRDAEEDPDRLVRVSRQRRLALCAQ
jgi:phosphatidylserine decarboxylase